MAKVNALNNYVETAFIAVLSLIALAGIIRFVVLSF
jgi:hypothetical protein